MISKKSRKVVAALLIGATICASGTFAYFNARTDLDSIEGLADDAQKTLNITNGKIQIQGKIAGTEATDISSLWGYDVARVSTIDAINAVSGTARTNLKTALGVNIGTSDTKVAYSAINADNGYIDKHRSPDLAYGTATRVDGELQVTATEFERDATDGTDGLKRTVLGASVLGNIFYARPGDAFALGFSKDGNTNITTAGITIDNQSNLTTKIGIRLNPSNDNGLATKAQLDAMNANGWKVYVKVINPLATPTANVGVSPYTDWTEITSDTFDNSAELTCAVATVKPGEAAPIIQLRVELPLTTVNYYQDRSTGNDTNGNTDFDITNLFEIVATQENNPGWNEDGSSANPITVSSTSTAP